MHLYIPFVVINNMGFIKELQGVCEFNEKQIVN